MNVVQEDDQEAEATVDATIDVLRNSNSFTLIIEDQDQDQEAEEVIIMTEEAVTEVDPTQEAVPEMTVVQETLRKEDVSNAVRRVTWRETAHNSEEEEAVAVAIVVDPDVDPPDPQDHPHTGVTGEEMVAAESIAPAPQDQEEGTPEEVLATTREVTAPVQEVVLAQELTEA